MHSEVIPLDRAMSRVTGVARSRADDIAVRLADIVDEISALPLIESSGRDELGNRSLAAFARILLRERKMRESELPRSLLGEPVWEILLDLFAADQEGKPVSISSACIASGAPASTALRYIAAAERAGLLTRETSPLDRRMSHLHLSRAGRLKMTVLITRMARVRGLLSEAHEESDRGARRGD